MDLSPDFVADYDCGPDPFLVEKTPFSLLYEAINSLLNAFSYIGEFNPIAFLPPVFSSFSVDNYAMDTGIQAKKFMEKSNAIFKGLQKLKIKPGLLDHPEHDWWHNEGVFAEVSRLLSFLQKSLEDLNDIRIPFCTLSIRTLIIIRLGILSFKKMSKRTIIKLNKVIVHYNRCVSDSNYKLCILIYPNKNNFS